MITPTNKEKMYREKIKYLSDNKKINNLDYIYSKILFNYEKNTNLLDIVTGKQIGRAHV